METDRERPRTLAGAAARGEVNTLREMLAQGSDLNEPPSDEYGPPLVEAAYGDHVDAARLLLEAGADLYTPNAGGETPLCMAIQQGSRQVFRLLVAWGCRLDPARDNAAWLLTQAAGADVNAPNILLQAAYNGFTAVVALLLAHGADAEVRGADGRTAEDYARERGHHAVVALLNRACYGRRRGPDR